ncbi:MAG: hypothetical protein ABI548_12905 [Polyangiaceae bacterium]
MTRFVRRDAFGIGLATLAVISGCGGPGAVPYSAPTPLPAVVCSDAPAEKQDVVACRYASQAQISEVWARSTGLAATAAVSLGFSHIQWLSAETHVETARVDTPIDCRREVGGIQCVGGPGEVPVGLLAFTRFTFLTPDEARARSMDALIPAERRPIDARANASANRR